MFRAEILADSITEGGQRLTTMKITYPRFVHSEFMTHRRFSRNAASSRAIPVKKMIERILENTAAPIVWGENRRGMEATAMLDDRDQILSEAGWYAARDAMIAQAQRFIEIGVHKQIANRLLEPFMWMTVIVSSTEWDNFFKLRCAKNAQPELAHIAWMMKDELEANTPQVVRRGEWHLPMIRPDELNIVRSHLIKVSAGRCARVSYLTHDGRRDIAEDLRLHDDLVRDEHWSPLEHQAQADPWAGPSGNFTGGWVQYRQMVEQGKWDSK